MRALWGMLAACAALSSLVLLGVQLISAGSELSYYLQLSVGVLLLVALFIAAQKGSPLLVTIAVLGSAALAASMPLDLTFSSSGLLAPGPSASRQVGEVIERLDRTQEYLLAMATLWLIHLILMATLAFSARQSARYRELLIGG